MVLLRRRPLTTKQLAHHWASVVRSENKYRFLCGHSHYQLAHWQLFDRAPESVNSPQVLFTRLHFYSLETVAKLIIFQFSGVDGKTNKLWSSIRDAVNSSNVYFQRTKANMFYSDFIRKY